jgi:orotate phosphoribosyltransferase-like protein
MIPKDRIDLVRKLKGKGLTDIQIAKQLSLTYHQVHYAKQLARLGKYSDDSF